MFNRLRLKLTMINLGIIAVIFLVLIVGTFILNQKRLDEGSNRILEDFARDAEQGRMLPPPPGAPGRDVFFIETTLTGAITHQSPNITDSAAMPGYVKQVFASSQKKGEISDQNRVLAYYRVNLQWKPAIIILFLDQTRERTASRNVLAAMSIAGIICSFLSLLGSLFMANRALVPIRKAWQKQQDFLADASHELRTPITVIQTNLAAVMAEKEEITSNQVKWINNIEEELSSMSHLVDSLLFLARADSRQPNLPKEVFCLDEAVASAIEPFQPVAEEHHLTLELDVDPLVQIPGDEASLKQVVAILLDNAIRHTPSGGTVGVTLKRANNKARLRVCDTGEGIPSEHLGNIFDRFYQVDTSRSKGGAGLGLSIAQWIVTSHCGSIQVTSTLGKGTTFNISLPLA